MIYLGSDHGGFRLKEKIKKFLEKKGYLFVDLGNKVYDKDDDYPDYAFLVAEMVSKEDDDSKKWKDRAKGILFCRSSAGMIIAANKFKNVRAVSVFDVKSAKHSRLHNDTNVIGISGDWVNEKLAKRIILAWLNTEFSNEERHKRRLKKIKELEEILYK
ncbi:MAG: RpiB/LacA/LacB family sugar-phosphate isomerase [Candidatus Woesearchaeota archaeon]